WLVFVACFSLGFDDVGRVYIPRCGWGRNGHAYSGRGGPEKCRVPAICERRALSHYGEAASHIPYFLAIHRFCSVHAELVRKHPRRNGMVPATKHRVMECVKHFPGYRPVFYPILLSAVPIH